MRTSLYTRLRLARRLVLRSVSVGGSRDVGWVIARVSRILWASLASLRVKRSNLEGKK